MALNDMEPRDPEAPGQDTSARSSDDETHGDEVPAQDGAKENNDAFVPMNDASRRGGLFSGAPLPRLRFSWAEVRLSLGLLVATIIVGLVGSQMVHFVPLGAVGVRTDLGVGSDKVLMPGRHVLVPVLQDVQLVATGRVTLNASLENAVDGNGIPVPLVAATITYQVHPEAAPAALRIESSALHDAPIFLPLKNTMIRQTQHYLRKAVGGMESANLFRLNQEVARIVTDTVRADMASIDPSIEVVQVSIEQVELQPQLAEALLARKVSQAVAALSTDADE